MGTAARCAQAPVPAPTALGSTTPTTRVPAAGAAAVGGGALDDAGEIPACDRAPRLVLQALDLTPVEAEGVDGDERLVGAGLRVVDLGEVDERCGGLRDERFHGRDPMTGGMPRWR